VQGCGFGEGAWEVGVATVFGEEDWDGDVAVCFGLWGLGLVFLS
jgi:hypothetical protein